MSIVQRGTAAGGVNGTGTSEYLELTLAPGNYTGNILIGVKRSTGGNYLWSFHLWVTNYDPSLVANQGLMPSGVTVMDRNLGATEGGSTTLGSYGLLYQWGRKDPFPSANAWGSNTLKTLATGSITVAAANQGTLINSVNVPYVYYPNGLNDWADTGALSGGNGCNRWGGNQNNTSTVAFKNTKTIYDPCPEGWRVPWGTNWIGTTGSFTSASVPSNFQWVASPNKCRIYTGVSPNIHFPSVGYKSHYDGTLSGVTLYGLYWSASTSSPSAYSLFSAETSGSGQSTQPKSMGMCVRPALDN